jgi:hypothetical protein
LLGIGSVRTFRGNRKTGKHELFVVVISRQFAQSCKIELIGLSAEFKDAFVGEFSVQVWIFNQRTAEAEEETNS